MTQSTLFGVAATSALDRAFWDFHAKNPRVYSELVRLARQAKDAGRSKVGIGMLFEVVRWHIFLETTDPDYKLNNNHRSRYARLIMDQEQDLDGIFELRELKT